MGEFLKVAEKNKGRPGPGRGHVGEKAGGQEESAFQQPPTLADAGVSKKESSNAQALVKIKEKAPQVYRQVRAGDCSLTTGANQG